MKISEKQNFKIIDYNFNLINSIQLPKAKKLKKEKLVPKYSGSNRNSGYTELCPLNKHFSSRYSGKCQKLREIIAKLWVFSFKNTSHCLSFKNQFLG